MNYCFFFFFVFIKYSYCPFFFHLIMTSENVKTLCIFNRLQNFLNVFKKSFFSFYSYVFILTIAMELDLMNHCACGIWMLELKPRLYERFFARAGDAIFSNFVASPARDENRTSSHP